MATTTKHDPPNSLKRRERTRKASKCQLCETKVDLKDQFTVQNDLENRTVVKKKNAARRGAEKLSHYCGDCADKRVAQKKAWMKTAYGEANGSDPAPARKKTAAKKTAAKPKAKAAAKKPVKKPKTAAKKATAKATKGDDSPF